MTMTKPLIKKILIIDDEPGVRQLISDFLRPKGYEMLTAEDGMDGLQKAMRFIPNLILLDIMMPKMDGWQALTKLRLGEKTRNIPVVMLTGRSDTESLLKSGRERALDYFIKPVNLNELSTFIDRYIGIRE